jgi:hypothetical protein
MVWTAKNGIAKNGALRWTLPPRAWLSRSGWASALKGSVGARRGRPPDVSPWRKPREGRFTFVGFAAAGVARGLPVSEWPGLSSDRAQKVHLMVGLFSLSSENSRFAYVALEVPNVRSFPPTPLAS